MANSPPGDRIQRCDGQRQPAERVDLLIRGVGLSVRISTAVASVDDGGVSLDATHPLVGKSSADPFKDVTLTPRILSTS